MKKSLLVMSVLFAATAANAQQKLDRTELMTAKSMRMETKAPEAICDADEAVKAPKKSKATGLYYTKPAGTAYMAWDKEGRGYGPTMVIVPAWDEFTFENRSQDPTTLLWHFNYISSTGTDCRDLTEYADANGSYTGSLNPGYYMAAPTLVNTTATDSFCIGKTTNSYWKGNYPTYFTQIITDSVTTLAFTDDHSGGYGWGSLTTGYLYGTGKLNHQTYGEGTCFGLMQGYPKPVSPMYVEDIYLPIKSQTGKPFAEGAVLKLYVLGAYWDENNIARETGDTIAVLEATEQDVVWDGEEPTESQYAALTGKAYYYNVTFTQKEVDEWGMEAIVPFVIDQQFLLKIEDLDNGQFEFGMNSVNMNDEDEDDVPGIGRFLVEYADGVLLHGYGASSIPFKFTAMFDKVMVADELTFSDNEGNAIDVTGCNELTVTDDGTESYVQTEQGKIDGVYVYTAQPWSNGEGDEYYFSPDQPEWITSLVVDESNFGDGNVNIVTVTAEPLPADVKGRMAEIHIEGRGFTAETPIIVIQGDREAAMIEKTKNEAKVAGSTVAYSLTGQKVGKNYKGIVVRDGKKYMVK